MTEITKFLAGFSANQVLTHGAFALGGVQFTLFGVHYDRGLNTAGALVWMVMLGISVWFAWIRKHRRA